MAETLLGRETEKAEKAGVVAVVEVDVVDAPEMEAKGELTEGVSEAEKAELGVKTKGLPDTEPLLLVRVTLISGAGVAVSGMGGRGGACAAWVRGERLCGGGGRLDAPTVEGDTDDVDLEGAGLESATEGAVAFAA